MSNTTDSNLTKEQIEVMDFIFYKIGANLVPADTKIKGMSTDWKKWQNTAMSLEYYESNKVSGVYDNGVAIICGKLWRGDYAGWYLNGIDSDNEIATKELCSRNGKELTVQELGEKITLTELHDDEPYRIHIYVISKRPFKTKAIGIIDKGKQPAIEVKADGKGLLYCSPSIHGWSIDDKERYTKPFLPWYFVKLVMPWVDENCEFEDHINNICQKYGLLYLDEKAYGSASKKSKFRSTIPVCARHDTLLTRINATIHELINETPKEEVRKKCYGLNNLCEEPLPDEELERLFDDSWEYVRKKKLESEEIELVSVHEAVRMSKGRIAVKGMIVGLSEAIHVVTKTDIVCSGLQCDSTETIVHNPPLFSIPTRWAVGADRKCRHTTKAEPHFARIDKHEYTSAVNIKLRDEVPKYELDTLNVILFNENNKDIRSGQKVLVIGKLGVSSQRTNGRMMAYLSAETIEYERKESVNVILTEDDKTELIKESKDPNYLNNVIKLIDESIIGHDDVKLGIVLMLIGAPDNKKMHFRGRIHSTTVGSPGEAKSPLGRAGVRIAGDKGAYIAAQTTSSISLVGVYSKENDMIVFRLGELPQAGDGFVVINEISSYSPDDQKMILDLKEEGETSTVKYGIRVNINGPVSILSITNPEGGDWSKDIVSRDKIPLRKEILDRDDLIFIFEREKSKDKKLEYAISRTLRIKKAYDDVIGTEK